MNNDGQEKQRGQSKRSPRIARELGGSKRARRGRGIFGAVLSAGAGGFGGAKMATSPAPPPPRTQEIRQETTSTRSPGTLSIADMKATFREAQDAAAANPAYRAALSKRLSSASEEHHLLTAFDYADPGLETAHLLEDQRANSAVRTISRASAQRLAEDYGPQLPAEVDRALSTRVQQTGPSTVDVVAVAGLIVNASGLLYTVYKDRKKKQITPSTEELTREIHIHLGRPSGLDAAEEERVVRVVVQEAIRAGQD